METKGSEGVERKLTAIMAADVVGYSRLMGDDHEATLEALTASREIFSTYIASHRGRIVNAPGDSILAEFPSVVDAVACAVEIQRALAERNAEFPDDRRMDFRIGVNQGDVLVKEGELFGDGVNVAARLESLADPAGICISGRVHEDVKTRLHLEFESMGKQKVKNIADPVPTYRVLSKPGAAAHRVVQTKQGQYDSAPRSLPDRPSIAVLPFINMSGDPEQEYFSDGLTEDLITDLSKLRGLHVTARNSAFVFKGRSVDLRQVGRELGVRHVLEGSVRRSGNRLRISAQLIDTQSDDHLWAERFDRELKDIFDLQDEITRAIVTELDVKLVEGESARAWRRGTNDYRAYDLFLRGISEIFKHSKEATARGRELFEKALAFDPEFAAAMTWLGWAYYSDAIAAWTDSRKENLAEALRWANRALAVDDSLALAHSLAGMVRLRCGEHDLAMSSLEDGVSQEPTGRSFIFLAAGLNYVGRNQEGLDLARKAVETEPFPAPFFYTIFGIAYRNAGRLNEAIETLLDAVTRAPEYFLNHLYLALAFAEAGRLDEARSHAKEVIRIGPHFSREVYFKAYKMPEERDRNIALAKEAGLP
ncbi:MAG: adenylate/guanylate cyclase domain-containing protein [SAR324 cluster bacterium]|nr:adenylate/guanylate cyclase domain-containing protein [SAR324 cluster bacterium]